MNVENIRKIISAIRNHENQFSMAYFVSCQNASDFRSPNGDISRYSESLSVESSPLHNCGTVCCLAGFANALIVADAKNGADDGPEFIHYSDVYTACDYMGISRENAYPLFYPNGFSPIWIQARSLGLVYGSSNYGATADEAIAVLEAIIDGRIKLETDF